MEIAKVRLINQQIIQPTYSNPAQLVEWMGAVQAQDLEMAKWAMGLRTTLPHLKGIENAINDGSIIRTHVLRPTWHFVPATRVYNLLQLTGPRIKTAMGSRDKQIGIDPALIKKSKKILEQMLLHQANVGRDEITLAFHNAGITNQDNRVAHLLVHAEIDGFIGSGRLLNNKHSYALLEERVPKPAGYSRDETIYDLTKTYFKSHGPATRDDFAWWSGLTIIDVKKALEMMKDELKVTMIGNKGYYFFGNNSGIDIPEQHYALLPAYDEYLISYKERSASITLSNSVKTISNNGIFRPILVKNGEIIGVWKKQKRKKVIHVNTEYFVKPEKSDLENFQEKIKGFIFFINA